MPEGRPPRARPSEVRRWVRDELERSGVDQADATADLLVCHTLGSDRATIATRTAPMSREEEERLTDLLERRTDGTPVQLLIGSQRFRSLDLAVRAGVFVPRPETESLVDHALSLVEGIEAPVAVDVGTGTGAIALAIAVERPDARIVATDLAPEAVDLARENARVLGLELEVVGGDRFEPVDPALQGRVDLVVSNPPYVETASVTELPVEVRADPPLALLGGPDQIATLADEAGAWLRPGGGIALEIGEEQADTVTTALQRHFADVVVRDDLAGRPRFVLGRRR
ncbi:MAG: peptide chain release factor N(5)-glutamine methyltransferase [Actinomycetota bacterium]